MSTPKRTGATPRHTTPCHVTGKFISFVLLIIYRGVRLIKYIQCGDPPVLELVRSICSRFVFCVVFVAFRENPAWPIVMHGGDGRNKEKCNRLWTLVMATVTIIYCQHCSPNDKLCFVILSGSSAQAGLHCKKDYLGIACPTGSASTVVRCSFNNFYIIFSLWI